MVKTTRAKGPKLTERKSHVKISRELHKRLKVWCAYLDILMEDYTEETLSKALDALEAENERRSKPLLALAPRNVLDIRVVSSTGRRPRHCPTGDRAK